VLSSVCGRVQVAHEPRTAWEHFGDYGPCSCWTSKVSVATKFFQSFLWSKHAVVVHNTLHSGQWNYWKPLHHVVPSLATRPLTRPQCRIIIITCARWPHHLCCVLGLLCSSEGSWLLCFPTSRYVAFVKSIGHEDVLETRRPATTPSAKMRCISLSIKS